MGFLKKTLSDLPPGIILFSFMWITHMANSSNPPGGNYSPEGPITLLMRLCGTEERLKVSPREGSS